MIPPSSSADRASREPADRRREWVAVAALLLAGSAFFAILESREPYYFLWDDNASFFLPAYVHNHDSVLGIGELPFLNYHQYLGHTHLASGQTAVLYPPLYAGLAAARLGWGDLRPAVDVLAILHFLAAALGMYCLLRHFEIRRDLAATVAFLWITFPFPLVVARSWIFVAYAAVYLPWSLWALERLIARPETARILTLAAIKALFFYQGYVQYVVLATFFECLYLALRRLGAAEATRWWRAAAGYAGAVVAAAALAAPQLVPMLQARQVSAYRTGSLSFDEFLSNALAPGTFLWAQLGHMEPRAIHLATGAIFYVGLPNLFALAWLARTRERRRFAAYATVALAALVLSTRAFGLMYHVPLLSSFRWPFKSFLVALVFFTVAAAAGYQAWLASRHRWARWLGWAALAAAVAGNLAIIFSRTLDAPFGPNRVDRDVTVLRAEAAQRFPLDRGRAISLWLSPLEPRVDRLLAFNYATLVGARHLGGYDPLVARENLDLALGLDYSNIFRGSIDRARLDHLSSWSVRFLLVPRSRRFPPIDRLRPGLYEHPQLRLGYRDAELEVWENAAALPFAFFAGPEMQPVEVEWGASSLRLRTGGRGGWLRVNVAPIAGYRWTADGADMGAVGYTPGRHLVVNVPDGTREVEIRYVSIPFRIGISIFVAFILPVVAVWGLRGVAVAVRV